MKLEYGKRWSIETYSTFKRVFGEYCIKEY